MLSASVARHIFEGLQTFLRTTFPVSATGFIHNNCILLDNLLGDIKAHIQATQTLAMLAVNAKLISLYWATGRLLDILNKLPEIKGFSERNLKRMLAFFRCHRHSKLFVPQAAAQIGEASQSLPSITYDSAQLLSPHLWNQHYPALNKSKPNCRWIWPIPISNLFESGNSGCCQC